ncbi:MAG: AAA family ATPase [Desulfobacterales bacterium]
MRIDKLHLIAFGPFTDTLLDLSGGNQGFHLIYGANEAGKSSALRALRHLLYGIPTRSTDNFIHPYSKMRIGATLRSAKGDILDFVRRKGRINTLRGPDDVAVLDETRLQGFLGNIDADFFAVMFGIGYEDLVRGGQDIVQGGGDVGRLVFSAGSGIVNLLEIQNDLQMEADRLFRPSGQKQIINESLGRLKHFRMELNSAQLKGQDWAKHDKALRSAEDRIKKVQAELDMHIKKLNRFQRIQQALPLIAERKDLENHLNIYANAVVLPETFADQRRELVAKLAALENQKDQAIKNIESSNQAISGLVILSELLNNGEAIEEIYQELGSQNKAAKDRIQLETRQSGLLAEAREILKNLGDNLSLEDAEKLRIKKTEAQKIRQLGSEYERIITRIEHARERLPEINREMAEIHKSLENCSAKRSTDHLQTLLSNAEDYGAQEKHLQSEKIEISSTLETIQLEQTRLKLKEKSPRELESLPIPSLETHRIFEARFDTIYHRLDDIQSEIQKVQNALVKVKSQLERDRLERQVPTEEDLVNARALRDKGWYLIIKKLNDQTLSQNNVLDYLKNTPDCSTLVEAFGKNLKQADDISDRLRREADRVASKVRLMGEKTTMEEQLKALETQLGTAQDEKLQMLQEWADLWKPLGIDERSPKEMIPWTNDFKLVVEKIKHWRRRLAEMDTLQENIDTHRARLTECLREFGVSFNSAENSLTVLIKKARSVVIFEEDLLRKQEQLMRERNKLENELDAARARLEASENDLNRWREKWTAAVRFIGLGTDALPDEANVVMDEIKNLFEKLKEAEILEKRIKGIDRDTDNFVRKINGLAEVVAPDLARRPTGDAAYELHYRLKQSRAASTKKETLEKQLEQEKRRKSQAEKTISELNTQLQSMCEEAGCRNINELPEAERHSAKKREIQDRLESNNHQLRRLSGGAAVADFIAEAQNLDPDSIDGEIDSLQETIDALNNEKNVLNQTVGMEKNELSKMDGSARAADLAEQIQIVLGGMEKNAEQYARLKIATKVLSMAVERYREKSQGPILKRASMLFNQITNQAFKCIRAEYDDKGQPVIVGIRNGSGDIVRVENMSDGTADQLYLALRLGGLEMYLEGNDPLPFIVDDILIKFDNDRASATLQALAKISEKTQLIFFTHHYHLVELAHHHIHPSVLFYHTLSQEA